MIDGNSEIVESKPGSLPGQQITLSPKGINDIHYKANFPHFTTIILSICADYRVSGFVLTTGPVNAGRSGS